MKIFFDSVKNLRNVFLRPQTGNVERVYLTYREVKSHYLRTFFDRVSFLNEKFDGCVFSIFGL